MLSRVGSLSQYEQPTFGDTLQELTRLELLDAGVYIDDAAGNGRTPLNEACNSRQTATAKFLIRRGAKIQIPDKHGVTCLMNAISFMELFRFLIHNGADVNAPHIHENTVLHRAISKEISMLSHFC